MMSLQFGLTTGVVNTQFATLAALNSYYHAEKVFEPLQSVLPSDESKLIQVVVSIFAGCEYISIVNTKLRPEQTFAQVNRIEKFADQSTLARCLNELTQMNFTALEQAVRQISHRCSRTLRHDWRGLRTIDFDLSGLPWESASLPSGIARQHGVLTWPGR